MNRTQLQRKAPLRRSGMSSLPVRGRSKARRKLRWRSTGPIPSVVDLVLARADGFCEWCGDPISGERGRDWSLQHRVPRQMGGSRTPWINQPSNLLLVHGDGTTGCHGFIESNKPDGEQRGFVIRRGHILPINVKALIRLPNVAGVTRRMRWVWLTDDGQRTPTEDTK